MSIDQGRVIVTSGGAANTSQVYHRDFPEIRADGQGPHAAAVHLGNHLQRAIDSALTEWRRKALEQAIKDVDEFVAKVP